MVYSPYFFMFGFLAEVDPSFFLLKKLTLVSCGGPNIFPHKSVSCPVHRAEVTHSILGLVACLHFALIW